MLLLSLLNVFVNGPICRHSMTNREPHGDATKLLCCLLLLNVLYVTVYRLLNSYVFIFLHFISDVF